MDFDIVVTDGSKRTKGLMGEVIRPLVNGVEVKLENGEVLDLGNNQYDYISENNVTFLFSSGNR